MNKNDLINNLNNGLHKVGFMAKQHAPEIMVVGGVVGGVIGGGMACRATLKVNDILVEAKTELEKVHACLDDEVYSDTYSKADAQKDQAVIYAKTGIKLLRLYGPSLVVVGASITSILAGNKILRKRNAALAAAYTMTNGAFKEYRNRVTEKFGEEAERDIRYAIKAKKFEEVEVDEKTGKEKKTKVEVPISELDGHNLYSKFFDEGSPYWEKNSEYNITFLLQQQQYANDMLRARGYLFLNDVYNMLGIEPTKAGHTIGWKYDPKQPALNNCVDFGIFSTNRETNRNFVNGYEPVILLDFNVDGDIISQINWGKY